MPPKCTVCQHKAIKQINEQIIAGVALRRIAADTGLSETALRRHRDKHLPEHLAKAKTAEVATRADNLISDLQYLRTSAIEFLEQAKTEKDRKAAASLISAAVKVIEVLAEVRGELNRQTQVNIIQAPVWIETRTVILQALAPYPEARQAVAKALEATCNNNR